MLIGRAGTAAFDWNGLTIRDFGALLDGAASVAVIEAPAGAAHPHAYSTACDKLYFVLEGTLRMNVDGVAYSPAAGDLIVVPKGTVFNYFDYLGAPSRLLLVHMPAFDPEAEHILPDLLREHDVHLRGEQVTLRPMTEEDWPYILAWNADPEVLIWSDSTDQPRPPEDVKDIYRGVSLFAYNFMVEYQGEPIGECWLQKMNLPQIIARFPGRDLRRIDLMIGRTDLWNRGLGTDTLRTLVRFAFAQDGADGIFGLVDPGNHRSRRAFEKAGFSDLPGCEGEEERPMVVWKERWVAGAEVEGAR